MNIDVLETLDFWLDVLRYAEKVEAKTLQLGENAVVVKVEIQACENIPYMKGSVLEVMVNADKQAHNKGQARLLHNPDNYKNTPEYMYLKRPYEKYVELNTFFAGCSTLSGCLFAEFLKKAAEISKLDELEKALALFETCNK